MPVDHHSDPISPPEPMQNCPDSEQACHDVPDPNGPPVRSRWSLAEKTVAWGALMGTTAFFAIPAISMLSRPCMGATRSSRLLQAEREQQMADELARFEQAAEASSSPSHESDFQ